MKVEPKERERESLDIKKKLVSFFKMLMLVNLFN